MIITQNGEVNVLILDQKSYEDMKNGNTHSEEDVFSSVEALLKNK